MTPARRLEIERLVELLDGGGSPVVITGSRGAGKTKLCEGMAQTLRAGARPCVVKWIERGGRNGNDEMLAEDVEKDASELLRQRHAQFRIHNSMREKDGPALPYVEVENGAFYLLVDGIEHLTAGHPFDASFLPVAVPRGMRLVVSVSHGPIADALAARGWHLHEVAPLDDEERREIIAKHVPPDQRRAELEGALAAWPHAGHPTHLAVAAAAAAATGTAPTASDDVTTIVSRLLERRYPMRENAALLAVAERGSPRFGTAPVIRHFDMLTLAPLIVERAGFIQPSLPEVRQIFRARATDEELRKAHLEAFEAYGPIRCHELQRAAAEHLLAIGERERLANYVTELAPFHDLLNDDCPFLARCWRATSLGDGPQSCDRMLERRLPGLPLESRLALINNLGVLASSMGWHDTAVRLKRRALEESRQAFPPWHAKIGTGLFNLALQLGPTRAHDPEVESAYQELRAIHAGPTPVGQGFPSPWSVLAAYADFLESRDRYDDGLACREEAMVAVRRQAGERHPTTAMELLRLSVAIRWRMPARALSEAELAYDILEAALGPSSERTAYAMRVVAAAQQELGLSEQALATNQRALEAGLALAATHPHEAGNALAQMADAAQGRDDRRATVVHRRQQYEHNRRFLGPDDGTTLSIAWRLAIAHEAHGELAQALELFEMLCERYVALKGRDNVDTVDAQLVAARLHWRLGRRAEAEQRLEPWWNAIAASTSIQVRGMGLLLRSEWAREDGHPHVQRQLLEQALGSYEQDGAFGSRRALFHVLLAGNLLLSGDVDEAARHHEAGVALLDDAQLHLRPLVLRPYAEEAAASPASLGFTTLPARARRVELDTMLALNGSRPGLDRAFLAARPLRAAWNPTDGHTLAVLDQAGQSHLFAWHPESLQLERLDGPLPKVELPRELAAFTLRWSRSGQALRLHTPDREETIGDVASGEAWAAASPLSPDGRHAVFFGRNSVFVMHSPARSGELEVLRAPSNQAVAGWI